jgi:hypothetical protein
MLLHRRVSMPGEIEEATYIVTLLDSTSSTKTQPDPCGPCSALEKQNGKDDAEGEAETRSNEKRGKAAVPLDSR